MDISALKKSRGTDFSKITNEFEKIANPQSNRAVDERIWRLEADKAGNGSAVIRFLPATTENELPWVRVYSHGFQGPTGKWYIENSLTTFSEDDPVAQLNSKLWATGAEENKNIAREQRRRVTYTSNVLIISDPKNPENEGQVKLFKYGKKIFDKLMEKARPTFADDKPVNVFDYWEGADFKFRMTKKDGYSNYDSSTFSDPKPIAATDEEILEIANKQHNLSEFLDRKNYKSFEALQKRLAEVLDDDQEQFSASDLAEKEFTPPPMKDEPAIKESVSKQTIVNDEDDDVKAFFNSIQ